MGKAKYKKRVHNLSTARAKDKSKELSLSARSLNRRLAITPDDKIYQLLAQNHSSSINKCGDLTVAGKSKKARKRALAKKKKIGAFGNLESLKDALPTVEMKSVEENKKIEKPRASKHLKTRDSEMMKDLLSFREIMQDPTFKEDPIGSIYASLKFRRTQDPNF
ncbi:hypothetical protein TNCV_1746681 [Trichonephila clavipes]|nr:hypothetical protein TNCV_1746681 [Trichonephila clavipes]